MASKPQAMAFLLLALSTLSFIINTSHAADEPPPVLTVYWGQNGNEGEGTLLEACATKNYDIVNLAFLNVFGSGRNPQLNFTGHCGDSGLPCSILALGITFCQYRNIKVFLSLGGAEGDYDLSSPEDAKEVAQYLHNNFLSGQDGPLGRVSLDGIDFDIQRGSNLYYDDLAKALHALSTEERRFYLSASPRCPYPDHYLDAAIKTGHFNYISVKFYNNSECQYSGDNDINLLTHFINWTEKVMPNNAVLLGLPAAPGAANGGFISPDYLNNRILPVIRILPNYGGVMLWNRYYDKQTDYSKQIRPFLQPVAALADAMYECVTKTLYRFYHVPEYAPPLRAVV